MMNAVVVDQNVRVLGAAVAALERIGHDITVEVAPTMVRSPPPAAPPAARCMSSPAPSPHCCSSSCAP